LIPATPAATEIAQSPTSATISGDRYDEEASMRRAATLALVTTLALAGCGDRDSRVRPGGPPSPGKWKSLTAKCPTLASPTAHALGVAGAGRPTPDYGDYGEDLVADCAWGSTDGKGTAAAMRLNVWHQPDAATAQWQVLTAGDMTQVAGVGDEATVVLDPPAVTVLARSANAVITMKLTSPNAGADKLTQIQPQALELTVEMLKSLR
jgi:hypothetical protein